MANGPNGVALFNAVADRILSAYLRSAGHTDVMSVRGKSAVGFEVDLVYKFAGRTTRIKVKPDAYFGTDPAMIHDRELPFYRSDVGHYAFEAVSNSVTREPGWILQSEADEIYYYYLVLGQREDEIRALVAEPDEVFLSELDVARDELRILPMAATRTWFERHFEDYTPRPVTIGDYTAWYRLVPRADIDGAVPGIKLVGSVFSALVP